MSAAIVVGYTATEAGRSAAAFGAALARSAGASLHLVVVLPAEGSRSPIVPKDRAYEEYIRTQAGEWLESAIAELPRRSRPGLTSGSPSRSPRVSSPPARTSVPERS